jgi:hypothetical protein
MEELDNQYDVNVFDNLKNSTPLGAYPQCRKPVFVTNIMQVVYVWSPPLLLGKVINDCY